MSEQVLAAYPETWCAHCGRLTGHDGWGAHVQAHIVDIYCASCGKKKESLPLDDIPPDLFAEIVDLFEERA